jgi:hypothetical protein
MMPAAVAALILAVVITGWWWVTRPAKVSTEAPKSLPAAGTCWTVDAATAAAQLPWAGATATPCTADHTAEVIYSGQVDVDLVRNVGNAADSQSKDVARLVVIATARASCLAHASDFLAGSFRNARIAVFPDFAAPADNGFYACVAAEVAGPDAAALTARKTSLKGALSSTDAATLKIDCVRDADDGKSLRYVPCAESHTAEFVGLYTVTPLGAPFNQAAVAKNVTAGCQSLVDSTLGLQPGQTRSDLRVSQVGPDTNQLWLGSDQTFACYAAAAQPWKGTLKGLGTRALTR